MTRFKVLLATLSLSVLAACASPQGPAPTLRGAVDPDFPYADTRSTYGQFLAGQAALRSGHTRDATGFFESARVLGGDDVDMAVRERAFTAALLAGDVEAAARMAPREADANEAVRRLGALTRVVNLMAEGKGVEARQVIKAETIGFPHRQATALLEPWIAAQVGDQTGATAQPSLQGDRLVQYFGQLGRARLLERAKRFEEAETDYKLLTGVSAARGLFTLDYGEFLERRRRSAEAVALYDTALVQSPGDTALVRARARASARRSPPPVVTLRQGAAQVLVATAASFMNERQSQFGLAYLRLALRLDPKRDDAWLLVGDVLAQGGDVVAAREAYGKLPPGSPRYVAAQGKLAWSLQSQGDKVAAVALAQRIAAAAPADRDAQLTYADLLQADERWTESAAVLDPLIAAAAAAGAPDWRLLYMRGVTLERAGRWPEAERDLKTALIASPDEPELLNYLGYSWVDRGENLAEALQMVQRAVAARPESGAMLDSLGWAHYRLGDYKAALENLEKAVELEPGDPDVNDHLGDVFWRLGRKDEARFQWTRVLSLEPTATQKVLVETKLKTGLGPAGPAVATTVATIP